MSNPLYALRWPSGAYAEFDGHGTFIGLVSVGEATCFLQPIEAIRAAMTMPAELLLAQWPEVVPITPEDCAPASQPDKRKGAH
jgi:hypothetical protein